MVIILHCSSNVLAMADENATVFPERHQCSICPFSDLWYTLATLSIPSPACLSTQLIPSSIKYSYLPRSAIQSSHYDPLLNIVLSFTTDRTLNLQGSKKNSHTQSPCFYDSGNVLHLPATEYTDELVQPSSWNPIPTFESRSGFFFNINASWNICCLLH